MRRAQIYCRRRRRFLPHRPTINPHPRKPSDRTLRRRLRLATSAIYASVYMSEQTILRVTLDRTRTQGLTNARDATKDLIGRKTVFDSAITRAKYTAIRSSGSTLG